MVTKQHIVKWSGFGAAACVGATIALDAYARSLGHPLSAALTYSLLATSVLAGACLLACGVTLAATSEYRWWRLLAIPAIAVGLFWSVLPVGLAMVAIRAVPASSVNLGERFEEFRVPAEDGAELAVSYRPGSNGATIVCLPGSGSSRRSVFPHAEQLARQGYGVVLVDPRGIGESTGKAMGYGWSGERDVRTVTDWLVAQKGVDASRIGVLGLSMGGEQALTAAANDSRLRAVVAEGASERSYEDVRRTLGGVSVALGVPQYRALFGMTELLSGERAPEPLEDLVARIGPREVLLLNTAHEAPYGQRYVEASKGAATLWAPSSEDHIGALAEQPEAWKARVIDFFDESLQ